MTFPPEPLVQIQNNFTEMFLMMASSTRDETKNMQVTVCMLSSSGIPQNIFSNMTLRNTIRVQTVRVQISVDILGTKCSHR